MANNNLILIIILASIGINFCPHPGEISNSGWTLFSIFIGIISLIVSNTMPMAVATTIGLTFIVLTKSLTFQAAFSGYAGETVWLVFTSFFIAQGFVDTGLATRIAYRFVAITGKKTLGLAYGLAFAECLLAPAIPSVTARSGAIIYPITKSLSNAFGSHADNETRSKLGTYLTLVVAQASTITSAMFLTAMAGNPLIVKLAKTAGIEISWGIWSLYAIVPGILCLLITPWLVLKLTKPEITETPHATEMARRKLKEMGPLSKNEIIMGVVFVTLLTLWIFGTQLKISAATTALLGFSFLILTGVIEWKNLIKLTVAFETFIWFGAFISLADALNDAGLTKFFGTYAAQYLTNFNLTTGFILVILLYFYIHYFFASATAHIGALYLPFLLLAIKLGASPLKSALLLGYASSLFGGLTPYGFGSSPILFGSGFISTGTWWKVGFLIGTLNLLIFYIFINLIG